MLWMWHMKAPTNAMKISTNLAHSRLKFFDPSTTGANALISFVVTMVAIAELSTMAVVAKREEAMTELRRVWIARMFFLS